MLEVTDDSGLLALVVPAAYESFVDRDWTFDQVFAHFRAQMGRRSILIWGTGSEGVWKVDVQLTKSEANGFREVSGPLEVVGGNLLLTNYESLTMAAQFDDVTLPEKHQEQLLVELPDGNYSVRIIQMFDPEQEDSAGGDRADFVFEVLEATGEVPPWELTPWFKVEG